VTIISLELVLVGWVIVIGRTKRQFPIANLLKVNSKPFLKKKLFTSWNVSKCPYRSSDIERKKNLLFFSMSFVIFVSFHKTI
jgi:hypothetical protein